MKNLILIIFLFSEISLYAVVSVPFLIEEWNIENAGTGDSVIFKLFENRNYVYLSYIQKWNLINYNSGVIGYSLKNFGNIQAGLYFQTQDDFIEISKEGVALNNYKIYDLGISLGYSRSIISKFISGLKIKYIKSVLYELTGQSQALDVLMKYSFSEKLAFNLSIENMGLGIKFKSGKENNPLPTVFKFGANLLDLNNNLNLYFNFRYYIYETFQIGAGLKFKLSNYLSLFGGYKYLKDSDFYGFSLGGELNYKNFEILYAFLPGEILGNVNKIGLKIEF